MAIWVLVAGPLLGRGLDSANAPLSNHVALLEPLRLLVEHPERNNRHRAA